MKVGHSINRGQWTDNDERIFLDGLGQWGPHPRDRVSLLQGYIAAAKFPRKSGAVRATRYAKNLLKIEGRI